MKKIYTSFKRTAFSCFVASLTLVSGNAFAQSICGPVVENFDNTGGSTAGFTGDFGYEKTGADGDLVKKKIVASAVYTMTTPTYQLANNATSIGFGFLLEGTEKVARAEVKIMYISTLTGEMTTVFLGQYIPTYNAGGATADICRAVAISDLPGFPTGGKYRFRIELATNTGNGTGAQTITFDNFRTNGTISLIPLPVNFIGLDAKKSAAAVQLTWKVAGEENVLRYEVEKSENGRNFTNIGSVQSSGKDTYTFIDANGTGTAFYRIRNVDGDGKYKYSTIVRIANGKSEIVLKAFPQPVQNQLTLQHPTANGNALISLSTASGQIVRSFTPASGSMQTPVDMSSLQPGLYLLRFDAGDGNTQTLKVVKQ